MRSYRTRGWRIQLTTALILVAAFGFFLWVWVPARQHSLREHNFRSLGDMSDQVSDTLNTLQSSLKNAAAESGAVPANFSNALALIQPRVHEVTPFTIVPRTNTSDQPLADTKRDTTPVRTRLGYCSLFPRDYEGQHVGSICPPKVTQNG